MKNFFIALGLAVTALTISGCCTPPSVRPPKNAGCIVVPNKLERLPNAKMGKGEIAVKFLDKSDLRFPTEWRVSAFDQEGKWRDIRLFGNSREKDAGLYVLEFRPKDKRNRRPVPLTRLITIPEEQRLTLEVTYTRCAGSLDCN